MSALKWFLLAAVAGCGGASSPAPSQPSEAGEDAPSSSDEATQRTIDRIGSWIADWNRHDLDAYMTHHVPGTKGIYIGQATPTPPKPIEDERAQFEVIWKLFPNAREDAVLLMANGDRGAFLWRVNTGAGQTFIGASMTGHASDGRIDEYHSVADGLTQLHQWGVRPSDDAPDAEPMWNPVVRAVGANPATEQTNVEILRAFSAAWSTNDTAALATLLAPNYSHRALPLKAPLDGPTLIEQLSERVGTMVSVVDVKETWGAGDWVVQRAELTMNFTAGENAGKSAKFGAILFGEIKDGKIARTIGAFNNAQVLVKLGEMTPEQFDAFEAKLLKKIGLDDAQ